MGNARDFIRREVIALGIGCVANTFVPPTAVGQTRLEITEGTIRPFQIAVLPFLGDTETLRRLGLEISQVIAQDLTNSGIFRRIDPSLHMDVNGAPQEPPDFDSWQRLQADALLLGAVNAEGAGRLAVSFYLWDIAREVQISGVRYVFDSEAWRRIAHRIADATYERLVGEPGNFDTRIVYVSESGNLGARIKRIAMMDYDGANHQFLTGGENLVLTPRFAPDGTHIAYLAYKQGGPNIYLHDLSTNRDTVLGGFSGMSFSPRFSTDGETMLMTVSEDGNADIFRMDIPTRKTLRLTSGQSIDTSPSFSPDESQIVFNSDRDGSPELYVMGSMGEAPRRISYGEGRYGSHEWSPRGDMIAFTVIKGGHLQIGVMRPDGGDERLLTRSFLDEGPTWSPNGRIIMYSREDPTTDRQRLRTIDITGRIGGEIPTPLDASDPDWSSQLH